MGLELDRSWLSLVGLVFPVESNSYSSLLNKWRHVLEGRGEKEVEEGSRRRRCIDEPIYQWMLFPRQGLPYLIESLRDWIETIALGCIIEKHYSQTKLMVWNFSVDLSNPVHCLWPFSIFFRNIQKLINTLEPVLDNGAKLQILHYLSDLLPEAEQQAFDRAAARMISRKMDSEQRKNCLSNLWLCMLWMFTKSVL